MVYKVYIQLYCTNQHWLTFIRKTQADGSPSLLVHQVNPTLQPFLVGPVADRAKHNQEAILLNLDGM